MAPAKLHVDSPMHGRSIDGAREKTALMPDLLLRS